MTAAESFAKLLADHMRTWRNCNAHGPEVYEAALAKLLEAHRGAVLEEKNEPEIPTEEQVRRDRETSWPL